MVACRAGSTGRLLTTDQVNHHDVTSRELTERAQLLLLLLTADEFCCCGLAPLHRYAVSLTSRRLTVALSQMMH